MSWDDAEIIDRNFILSDYDRSTERRKLWHYQTFSDGAERVSSSRAQHAEQRAEQENLRRSRQHAEQRAEQENLRRSRQRVEQRVEQQRSRKRSRQHVERHVEHLISNQAG